ncbi:MAG TPA: ATP-binding protein [Chitinophagaceae bacterium]|nr:ATP-binding protein [Chitinophagaceae bacterium]
MLKGWLKYLALIIFLLGLILIVFLQFNSGKSIDRLIQGNTSLLTELKAQNDLQKLQTDIVSVESKVRGSIITQDTAQIVLIKDYIQRISGKVNHVEGEVQNEGTGMLVHRLDLLVARKVAFNQRIIDTFTVGGKLAAERIINANSSVSKRLTDSIFDAVDDVDSSRQVSMSQIINSIDDNGRTAKSRGVILAAVACLLCIVAFWFIVHQSMEQQTLIRVLDRSEKKVKEAAKIKEQFMANMSHEIRTPMNAILGFTNLLGKTDLSGLQKQYVENIQSSGENLLTIVNDILDLSKIEAGMMRIERTAFSLRGLMHSIETMFTEKARLKQLYLRVHVAEELPDILEGDPVRLTQILVNLLGNAVKFTDRGGITVTVSGGEHNPERVPVHFTIADTGIGIPRDKLDTIFERFQQAEADTTRRYGGTGLGLSIAKQLIELQGGSISLSSEPGKGTTFQVYIPYMISRESVQDVSRFHVHPSWQGPSRKIRILIAEDNVMNQQLMKHLMQAHSIDFDLVDNGVDAARAAMTGEYDIILMDIQMPGMDGYKASQLIREEINPGIPIIAMTAHAMAGEKEKCLSYGMSDYISKPIREEELFFLIQRYTGTGNGREAHTPLADPGIIDLSYLREISKGDRDFEREMIRQFTVQVPEDLRALKAAVEGPDYPRIRSLAHGLKSAVSFMGFSGHIIDMLLQMEKVNEAVVNREDLARNFSMLQEICLRAVQEANELLK